MGTYTVMLEIHGDKVYRPGDKIELAPAEADNLRFIGYIEPAESGEPEAQVKAKK